jgi:hypothetical protein
MPSFWYIWRENWTKPAARRERAQSFAAKREAT